MKKASVTRLIWLDKVKWYMMNDDVCDDKSWHCDTENFTDYRNRVFHVFD